MQHSNTSGASRRLSRSLYFGVKPAGSSVLKNCCFRSFMLPLHAGSNETAPISARFLQLFCLFIAGF
jgi:hypothetical protein